MFFCEECSERVHRGRDDHKLEEVRVQVMGDVSIFSNMQLLSVICIETSHVCFIYFKWLISFFFSKRMVKL